eukprot:c26980_g1_i1.p1 GENE.c26980_g1_i1~~c26980_g1_i1.p1  ORF type:complete len:620 (+),score=184.98 c26980_g1_i1:70-1860(+)
MSDLANSPVNLAALREYSRKQLTDILDSIDGPKVLVLDKAIQGPVGLVAEVALFKEHNVQKIHHLNSEIGVIDIPNVIYLCRPKMRLMRLIASHILANKANKKNCRYSLFFVPRQTLVCRKVLEREGVIDDVQIGEFALELIPYDDDVLYVGVDSFRECFLDGDDSSLFYVARAIMRLQTMFGLIPNIKAKGTRAETVLNMLKRFGGERGQFDGAGNQIPEIENLIILDRDVDLVTPLLSQLTYEGLVDETMGIIDAAVELDSDMLGKSDEVNKDRRKIKLPLNHSDRVFSEIRDMNFSVLGPTLTKKAKYIHANYEERHTADSVTDLRNFTKKLEDLQAQHRSLTAHTNIADKIGQQINKESFHRRLEVEQGLLRGLALDQDYIEECINKQEPLNKVLRLLCLASLTNNGLKTKQFDLFRREIIHTYGFDKLFTLHNLEKLGLLKQNEPKAAWPIVRKALRLVVDDVDEQNPKDISYVYSGYAPLTVRLVEQAAKPEGWRGIDEALRSLPGPTNEWQQQAAPSSNQIGDGTRRSVTLVFFVGGCTFTEIAAMRFLGKDDGGSRDYLIATTHIINGNTMMDSVGDTIENNLDPKQI